MIQRSLTLAIAIYALIAYVPELRLKQGVTTATPHIDPNEIIQICGETSRHDLDGDGINDLLEQRLARNFAPEWRFNFWRNIGSQSAQDQTELAYPSSVEWFKQEVEENEDHPLLLSYPTTSFCDGDPSFNIIDDVDNLIQLRSPLFGFRADSIEWPSETCLQVTGYSTGYGGQVDHFPTYVHVVPGRDDKDGPWNGDIEIEYYLWFPWDFTDAPFGAASHRGDWENIKVVITGITQPMQPNLPLSASISRVVYYGHELDPKLLEPGDPTFSRQVIDGIHPRVYVAFGMHAMYPEPGELPNHTLSQDDQFHGNGYVVQAWHPARELVNLGEYCYVNTEVSFEPWIRYIGRWGPDQFGFANVSSPPGPVWRGRWGPTVHEATQSWENMKLDYTEIPFRHGCCKIDEQIPEPGGMDAHGQEPRVLLSRQFNWEGEYEDLSVGIHHSLDLDNNSESVLLIGGARLLLYDGSSLQGARESVTHSCDGLENHHDHGWAHRASSAVVEGLSNEVHVDWKNREYYQDGTARRGELHGPYGTIGKGISYVQAGGVVRVQRGVYPEMFAIARPMRLEAIGGKVLIGDFSMGSNSGPTE